MDIDLLMAIGHHLAVFLLVSIFAAEFALLRRGLPDQASANWHGSMRPMAASPRWSSWWAYCA